MGLKEIIKRLEPKIIQYLTIEREVVEEIHKELFAGTLDRDEWNDYYIKIVEQYGNPIMIEMIKGFRGLQDLTVQWIGEENIKESLKKLANESLTTTTEIPTYMNTKEKEGKIEDLHGNLYELIIKNGVYICPKCEGLNNGLIQLNSSISDPDYLHFRCLKCKMDFKILNKEDKDFKWSK